MDLNFLARASLTGLTEEPERHLSTLLRSRQPIEQSTRLAMADALDGKSKSTSLKVIAKKDGGIVMRFRKMRRQIEIGKSVKARMPGMTYAEAVKEITAKTPYSEKSVERFFTLAKVLERWIAECRNAGREQSEEALETAFIYSAVKRIDRDDAIKPSLETLQEIINNFESLVVDAEGITKRRR